MKTQEGIRQRDLGVYTTEMGWISGTNALCCKESYLQPLSPCFPKLLPDGIYSLLQIWMQGSI